MKGERGEGRDRVRDREGGREGGRERERERGGWNNHQAQRLRLKQHDKTGLGYSILRASSPTYGWNNGKLEGRERGVRRIRGENEEVLGLWFLAHQEYTY